MLNDLFLLGATNSLPFRVVVINFLLYIHLADCWHLAIFILHSDTSICPTTFSYSLSNLKCIELLLTVRHMPERVDDNLVKLSMEADTVRVCGLVDKHNFPVNALHIKSCHMRISFLFFKWKVFDISLLSVSRNQRSIISKKYPAEFLEIFKIRGI